MIRKEIKHFRLKVGEYENIGVSVPCSVISALFDEGLIREPYFGANASELSAILSGGAVFLADFEVDPVMLGQDSLLLRLRGVDAPLVLSVNGAPIAGLENAHVPYEINIKSRVVAGKNTLMLRFAPRMPVGEYLKDAGIFAPIELISYNKAIIDDVVITQKHEGEKVRLGINMTTLGYNLKPSAVAVLTSPGGAISYCTLISGKGEMLISNPNLWRPGKFRTHRLYRLTVNLYSDSELIDSREYKVGLRSVELREGSSPALSLSSSPYSPIALRYTSADLVKPRATEQRVELMLRRMANTGADMLLVDPADSYPSEHFLSCCDELGIALAIKAISPKHVRTGLGERLSAAEISSSLKRLAAHPSVLLLICNGAYADMLRRFASDMLPNVLALDEGPELCKFIPSLPTDYTSRTYLGENDMNINSPALTDRGVCGLDHLMTSVLSEARMPRGFGEWTYLSGVLSAERAVKSVRDAYIAPRLLGVCVEDLSEPLPKLSASVLDYSGRVKASYYYLARATAPRCVFATLDGTKVSFYAVNREANAYKCRLNYAVVRNDNRVIVRDSVELSAVGDSVSRVYEYDVAEVISGHESEYYICYSITDSVGTHSRNTLLFVPYSRFGFKKPDIVADISGSGSEYTVSLFSDVYAGAVEVWFEGEHDVVLEDNFIDITSDVPVRISLTTSRPTAVETLKRELRVRSMYDVGR